MSVFLCFPSMVNWVFKGVGDTLGFTGRGGGQFCKEGERKYEKRGVKRKKEKKKNERERKRKKEKVRESKRK